MITQFRQLIPWPFAALLLASILVLVVIFAHLSVIKTGFQASVPSTLKQGEWRFIVSGDSRNCGDVVMPAIAANSARYAPSFYWHLGDLRAIYKIDEDMAAASAKAGRHLSCQSYYDRAWPDFIENQIAPFGITRFYVGIGNHEVIEPKNAAQFTAQFSEWLLTSRVQMSYKDREGKDFEFTAAHATACGKLTKEQFLGLSKPAGKEKPYRLPYPYYHWIQDHVDFIYLDNSLGYFGDGQLNWFECVLAMDEPNEKENVRSVVVGMHDALPGSLSSNHAMCDDQGDPNYQESCDSGKRVYDDLVNFRKNTSTPVYILASHSHFYMSGIFDKQSQKGLPGWIVGTAGAVRYSAPPGIPPDTDIKTNAYGYLLATVHPDRKIDFEFKQVTEKDVPNETRQNYPSTLVPWCYAHNSEDKDPNSKETTNRCSVPQSLLSGRKE